MRGEIDRRSEHEHHQHELDRRRIEERRRWRRAWRNRPAPWRRTRGRWRRTSACPPAAAPARRPAVMPRVHQPQRLGGLGDARRQLGVLHRAGRFGAVHLHAADAQQRQDGHRQHDDAHAAQPVQRVAPQVHGVRQRVEPADHGGAGGRESRHGLEVGVGERQVRRAEHHAAAPPRAVTASQLRLTSR